MSTIIGPDDVKVDGRNIIKRDEHKPVNPALALYIILVNEAPTIVSWSDLALANDAETMEEISLLGPGDSTILGMSDSITRLREDGTIEAEAKITLFSPFVLGASAAVELVTGPFAGQAWGINKFPGSLRVVESIVGPKYILTFDPRPLVTG